MEDNKKEILMQSKNLVETSYNVTAIQNRVFYHCLFAAQKEKNGELYCTIKLEDVKKLIPNRSDRTLANIKRIFKVFRETALLFDKEDDGDLIECDYNLIAGSEYNTNKKEFKIFFMDRLYQHILSYSNYAPLNLEIMSKFTSFYSQRLYEALRMWSRTNIEVKHIFRLDTLRFILGVGDKYPEYKNLKQRVLNQALKEINAVGNMKVDIKEIKEGRRVTKIEFIIFDNEQKKYFSKSEPISLKEEPSEETEKESYVNLPYTELFEPKFKDMFIDWCYDECIGFDENITRLFNESVLIFKAKKNIKRIRKINEYKYFLGIFQNKVEDDINNFVALTHTIFRDNDEAAVTIED